MIIGLGADPFGVELKESVKRHLEMTGYVVQDLGGSNDRQHTYYDVAHEIAEKVGSGTCERGVLVCGTGAWRSSRTNTQAYMPLCARTWRRRPRRVRSTMQMS